MKIDLTKCKKVSRIIARGEVSGHAHIATGEVNVYENENGEIILDVYGKAAIKHLIEEVFTKEGKEQWTGEHTDIALKKGQYKYVQQIEFDPYIEVIRKVQD